MVRSPFHLVVQIERLENKAPVEYPLYSCTLHYFSYLVGLYVYSSLHKILAKEAFALVSACLLICSNTSSTFNLRTPGGVLQLRWLLCRESVWVRTCGKNHSES